jgi:hypothetical protein
MAVRAQAKLLVQLRLSEEDVDWLDDRRRQSRDLPGRSVIVHQLIEEARRKEDGSKLQRPGAVQR